VNSDMYNGLRQRVLDLDPAEIGFAPTAELPDVYGLVLDLGFGDDVATLVTMLDGTTSLYVSSGGGMIGAGQYPQVVAVSQAALRVAQRHLADVPPSTDTSLPGEGRVAIRVLTYGGRRAAEASDSDLTSGTHPLSPVFDAAHDVITQLRLLDEARS
jgi:hypothetical protein